MLRWRLIPGDYTLLENGAVGENLELKITSDMPIHQIRLASGDEALYYMQRSTLPVLEINFYTAGKIVTTIRY